MLGFTAGKENLPALHVLQVSPLRLALNCCERMSKKVLTLSHIVSFAGTYSGTQADECTMCPAGSACSDPSANPVACLLGYYSLGGVVTACTPCPAGHACSTQNTAPVPCGSGTYSAGTALSCSDCPEGQSCLDPAEAPVNCDGGYYSPLVSGQERNCVAL